MTPTWWGAVAGAGAGLGLLLVVSRLMVIRRPQLAVRVLPYVRDVPRLGATASPRPEPSTSSAARGVFGPVLRAAADTVERVLGGSESVRRRLERADLDATVHDFRVEQVLWGLAGFAAAAGYAVLRALGNPGASPVPRWPCASWPSPSAYSPATTTSPAQVRRRERRVLAEFPTIAELLALAVAAGESPVTALERVVKRSGGELSGDLGRVLAAIRTGEPVAAAFDQLAARSGLPLVARFAQGIAVAIERGTPLADVLHAQAADVREAGRRELIEVAARREILMMVPVVFLVLPITILFAFWPGVVGLSLTTP